MGRRICDLKKIIFSLKNLWPSKGEGESIFLDDVNHEGPLREKENECEEICTIKWDRYGYKFHFLSK